MYNIQIIKKREKHVANTKERKMKNEKEKEKF